MSIFKISIYANANRFDEGRVFETFEVEIQRSLQKSEEIFNNSMNFQIKMNMLRLSLARTSTNTAMN
jgi:hypothetical protein